MFLPYKFQHATRVKQGENLIYCTKLSQSQSSHEMMKLFTAHQTDLVKHPFHCCTHCLVEHRTAHFAHRLKATQSPITQTGMTKGSNRKTVRKRAVSSQSAHAHFVRFTHKRRPSRRDREAAGMQRPCVACACPTISIRINNSSDVPIRFVRQQYLLRFSITFFVPQKDNPAFVIRLRYFNRYGKVPLLLAVTMNHLFTVFLRNCLGKLRCRHLRILKRNKSVRLQIADITANLVPVILQRVDVIQYLAR